MSTHSDDRPFECENCGRKFAIKAYLDKHKQHHIQEFDKPFECEVSLSFVWFVHLQGKIIYKL